MNESLIIVLAIVAVSASLILFIRKPRGKGDAKAQESPVAQFVEHKLPPDVRPLLGLVGVHAKYLDSDHLEHMCKQVDNGWTRALIDQLMGALDAAGLARNIGDGTFQLNPLLTSYLQGRGDGNVASPDCLRAFVGTMATIANQLTSLEPHEQRMQFLRNGANFAIAHDLSERFALDRHLAVLTGALASSALNSGHLVEASRLYTQAAQRAADRGDSKAEAAAYHQLGKVAAEQREFEEARNWYGKSLAIQEKLGNEQGAAIDYHQLGRVAQEEPNLELARVWYLKSLAIAEKHDNLPDASGTYYQLGMMAQDERNFETAAKWYLKSLPIVETQGNEHNAASLYHQLGMIAAEEQNFEAARQWYLKSLAIKQEQGNQEGTAISFHQLGVLAQAQQNFGKAREWYLKALALSEKQGNLQFAAASYHNLGVVAYAQKDYDTARAWCLKSAAIKEEQGNPLASDSYHQLGMIAQQQEDFEGAVDWYHKSLEIWEARVLTTQPASDLHGNIHKIAKTGVRLGAVLALQGKLFESGYRLIRSIIGFQATHNQAEIDRATELFIVVCRQAPPDAKQKLEEIWAAGAVGRFPEA